MARSYRPRPIDTSAVVLGADLEDVVERLARNAHEAWARQRLSDGWRHGPRRDDVRKEHPGLVPYEALSEAEKRYDRGTVTETLKALLALGYAIVAPGEP